MARLQVSFPEDLRDDLILLAVIVVASALLVRTAWRWRARHEAGRGDFVSASVGLAGLGIAAAALAWPRLAGPHLLLPTAAMLCFTVVASAYTGLYHYLGARRAAIVLVIRCLAIAVILAALFRPMVALAPTGRPAASLAVLIDASRSMSVPDARDGAARYARAARTCRLALAGLGPDIRPVVYVFDSQARAVDRLEKLADRPATGPRTNLTAALQAAGPAQSQSNLLGVVLITDGNHNEGGDPVAAAGRLARPVYTVGVGGLASDVPDIAISAVEAPEETAVNNTCQIAVRLKVRKLADRTIAVQLVRDDQLLQTRRLALQAGQREYTTDLSFKPTTLGRKNLLVKASIDPAELITHNNRQDLSIWVSQRRIRLLYIEGRIRPEFKFLRQELASDADVELLSIEQRRAPGWTISGSVGGRQPTELPDDEGFARFVRQFDLILLGDVHSRQLGAAKMAAIRDAVRDGKGLLMIGGQQNFGPGGYAGTAIEQALPVRVGGQRLPDGTTRQMTRPFLPVLTAQGRAHPIFRGLQNFFAAEQSARLPLLRGCVLVDGPKPGAEVLAVAPVGPAGRSSPIVLAVQNFGQGRSAALTVDTTGQWYLARKLLAEPVYSRFWGQLVRWLAGAEALERATGPGVELRLSKRSYRLGQDVPIVAVVRDEQGRACSDADVVATIRDPQGRQHRLPLAPVARQPGRFGGNYRPEQTGQYALQVTARRADLPLGQDRIELLVGPRIGEMDRLSLNADLLQRIARVSGGRYVALASLGELISQLADQPRRAGTGAGPTWRFSPFDHPFGLLGIFVVLVCGEWLLRQRWRLQ